MGRFSFISIPMMERHLSEKYSEYKEYKANYGRSIICAYARIDGWAVGIVANQPRIKAGCLDVDASDKAARFIMNCNQKRIPLVFLQDVTGFMVGSR